MLQGLDFSVSIEDLSGLFDDGLVKNIAENGNQNGAQNGAVNGHGGLKEAHDKPQAGMDEAKHTGHQAPARNQAELKPHAEHAELRQAQLKNYAWVSQSAMLI